MPSYVDLNSIQVPVTGGRPPATYAQQIRDNFEVLRLSERVIARTVLTGAAASIDSGTLPTVANGWKLRAVLLGKHATSDGIQVNLRFNGDTGANYSNQLVFSADTTPGAAEAASQTSLAVGNISNANPGVVDLEVVSYLGTTFRKLTSSQDYDARALSTQVIAARGGIWASTAAITSVLFFPATGNFLAGTELTVLATPSS